MRDKILLALDGAFAIYGLFWAGIIFVQALPLNYDFWQWLLFFSVIVVFLYPLIRKTIEVLVGMSWEDFKYAFKENYKDRAKKRWEY